MVKWMIGFWIICNLPAFAQNYKITIDPKGYQGDTILLGYHYGHRQYLRDTAFRTPGDIFIFEGPNALEPGLYMAIFPPKNDFIQFSVGANEQEFKVTAESFDQKTPTITHIVNSPDNQILLDYTRYLEKQRPESERLQALMKDSTIKNKEQVNQQILDINKQVVKYQEELIKRYPASMAALLIRGNKVPDIPDTFTGTEQEINEQKYRYYHEHYFDATDFSDVRLVRTPFIQNLIINYFEKVVVQHPDSVIQEVDRLLDKMKPNGELYRYTLIELLNYYAKVKFVGFDAIYVHIADNYFSKGEVNTLDKKQLDKIADSAAKLRPLLIGRQAPDIAMRKQNNEVIRLHEVRSPYTILFVWDPDCGHCKKSMPKVEEFYANYKNKGVEIFAVCGKFRTKEEPTGDSKCWEFIEQHAGMKPWLNVVDPYHQSNYKIIYDIKMTPQIYVLDENKVIKSKQIDAEDLPKILDFLLDPPIKTVTK